jgi:hypothetical protein
LPPQPLCLASLPTNQRASSPSLCPCLSSRSARRLPLILPKKSRTATIPFRITSFADPHHLTPIESYSYKNRGRGWGHSLQARFPNAFLHSATVNSNRIRSSAKRARNPFRIRSFRTQDLNPFRMRSSKKTGGGALILNQISDEEICPDEQSEEGPLPKSGEGFLSRATIGSEGSLQSPDDQRFLYLECFYGTIRMRARPTHPPKSSSDFNKLDGTIRWAARHTRT